MADSLFAWNYNGAIIYTKTAAPVTNDFIYKSNGEKYTYGEQIIKPNGSSTGLYVCDYINGNVASDYSYIKVKTGSSSSMSWTSNKTFERDSSYDVIWCVVSKLKKGNTNYELKDATARASIANLATVAISGSYNDLSNKPTIPTTTDSVTSGSSAALTSGGAYTALGNKLDTSKVKSSSSSTSGDVYDVTYINTMLGNIESLLGGI